MSVIIRLQNLPLSAISIDIRNFFRGLSIPDGGVHIVGGADGDAFIAFSTDEDARQAMQLVGQKLKDSPVRLLLSSRNEMMKVIEQARIGATAGGAQSVLSSTSTPSASRPSLSPPKSTPKSLQDNVAAGNFSQFLGAHSHNQPGMLGMGGMNGSAATNYLNPTANTSQTSGIMLQQQGFGSGGGGNSVSNFPTPGSGIATSHMMGSTNTSHRSAPTSSTSSGVAALHPFGMPPGMQFPPMIPPNASTANLHGINPALMMNMPNMGVPPPMFNLSNNAQNHQNSGQQQSGTFPSRNMINNGNSNHNNMMNSTSHSNSNTNNVLASMGQQHLQHNNNPMLRPGGGFPVPGMNPAFMAGGSGGMNNNNSQMPSGGRVANSNMTNMGNMIRQPPNMGRPGIDFSHRGDLKIDSRPSSADERRDRDRDRDITRRRRSRSRERERGDRRRRSKSRSRSRSPKGRRRDSRDKDDRRSKGEGSPDKNRGVGRRNSRDSADPPPNAYNMTDEHHPAIKLTGVPNDASFREIKDLLRVEIMGGGDGTVRLYEENVAYVKLEKPSEFPRAYRSNGRRLRNSVVSMEGIPIERWVDEYKLNKSRVERDVDRDRLERGSRDRDRAERHRDRDDRGGMDREQRSDRGDRSSDKEERDRTRSSRPSRFNTAPQSSFIVIRNLPPTVTNKDVSVRLLKETATDVVVAAGPMANGRHTAVAFVKLPTPQQAQQAIDLIVRSQDGSHLVVEASSQEDFNRAKDKTPGAGRGDDSASSGGAKSIFELESGLDDESCAVMLRGAPANVNERDIFDFFSDIGLVPMNVKVMYDTQGMCNGQVICEFPDPHKARRATTKDGMLLGRGHVQVELLPSGRKRMLDPAGLQMKGLRPSLLGSRPPPGMNPRFGVPPNGPNPFVQALQSGAGPRSPGIRSRGPNPNNSRFGMRNDQFGTANGVDRDDRMSGIGRGRGGRVSTAEANSGFPGAPNFGKAGCVIALENVPFKASMDDILHHLSSILKLDISRERIIRRFDDSDKPTGDARVAFDTAAEAKLAHDRLLGTKMWNRLISYTIL